MVWIYFLLLLITDTAGLLLAAFTLPGLWLMLAAAALYAWLTHGYFLSYKTLITLLIFAGISEIAELFVTGAGAKKAGASRWGILGGLIGAILGGIFLTGFIPIFAPLSTVIGICLGTFLGAFFIEFALGQSTHRSIKIGYGAAKGRLLGIFGKVTVGVVMLLITIVTAFPIGAPPPPPPAPLIPPLLPSTQPATNPVTAQTPVLRPAEEADFPTGHLL